MNRRSVLALFLVALLVLPAPAAAAVRGSPDISLAASDNRFEPGEAAQLGVSVVNTGDLDLGSSRGNPSAEQRVTTARGLTLTMESGEAPIDVKTGTVAVGSVPEGVVGPLPFEIVVDEDAKPGTYEVPVEVEYTYTSSIGEDVPAHNERTVTDEKTVEIRITEESRFEIVNASTDASIGGSGSVEVAVENTGRASASDATFTLQSKNADLTFGQASAVESYVGEWESGEVRTFSFAGRVAGDAERRPLALDAVVSYQDTDGLPAEELLSTGVVPAAEQRVSAVGTGSTAAVGDSGRVGIELRNTGEETLEDATVTFESTNAALTFGGAQTARTFVGEWAPGESRRVVVEAQFAPTAEEREYAVDATVSYTGPGGQTAQAAPVTVGVSPAADQTFSVESPEATLRVGEEGTLSGTLVNEGPQDVENAVLVFQPTSSSIDVPETEYALGNLGAGESAQFEYEVDVSSETRDGPRQFTYLVRYDDSDGDTVESDPIYTRHTIAEKRQVFEVTSNATVAAGDSSTLEVEVTNNGDQELSDISAKLFADAPISVEDDEAFVDSLGPGETETIRFEISAAGSATAKTYPVSMDFQYDEPDGDTKLSETYQLPVRVTESGGGGLFGFIGVGVGSVGLALALTIGSLAAVGLVYRKR